MKPRTVLFVLLLVIAGMMIISGCEEKKPDPVPVGEMPEYRDPGYGFKIHHPADWKQLGTVGKAVFAKSSDVLLRFQDFQSGEMGAMAQVTVHELQGKTTDDLMSSLNAEMGQYAQMEPEQQIDVAGKPAKRVNYSFQATTKYMVKGFVVHVPGDTALYTMDFRGYGDYYDAYAAVFDAMLKSFEPPVVQAKGSDAWQPKEFVPYTSNYFNMQYPEDMEFVSVKKGDKDHVVQLRAPRRNDCSIQIDVFGAKGLTIEKVWDQNKGRYKARQTGQSTVDGQTAYWVDYSVMKDINSRAYFVVKNDKVIRITMNWFQPERDVYFTTFEKVVNSIKLK